MLRKLVKWETAVKLFLMIFCISVILEVYLLSKSRSAEFEELQNSLYLKEGDLPPELLSRSTPSTGQWQPVVGTRFKFYVYSAHYDRRPQTLVRIIGATRLDGSKVVCQIFPTGNKSQYTFVPATIKPFDGQEGLPFSAVSITCLLPQEHPPPWAVSVSSASLPVITNLLSIQIAPLRLPENYSSIVACVEPIDSLYSQTVRLIEFIEMNTLLGVNHFMFYNQSTTPEVSCLLQHYAQQGRVTVLPWEFDLWSKALKKVSHSQGILAAVNDCLLRSRNFGYAVPLDVDQFLVPRNSNTIQEFIESKRETGDLNHIGAFSISNVNFYQEWPDHVMDSYTTLGQYMMTILKTRRTKPNFADSPKYSALICKPYYTLAISAEYLPELLSGQKVYKTKDSEVLSHRYVSCGTSSVNCSLVPSILDTTLHRHKDNLNQAMLSAWKKALPSCLIYS